MNLPACITYSGAVLSSGPAREVTAAQIEFHYTNIHGVDSVLPITVFPPGTAAVMTEGFFKRWLETVLADASARSVLNFAAISKAVSRGGGIAAAGALSGLVSSPKST